MLTKQSKPKVREGIVALHLSNRYVMNGWVGTNTNPWFFNTPEEARKAILRVINDAKIDIQYCLDEMSTPIEKRSLTVNDFKTESAFRDYYRRVDESHKNQIEESEKFVDINNYSICRQRITTQTITNTTISTDKHKTEKTKVTTIEIIDRYPV